MLSQKGERVGAILSEDGGVVNFLGYGVYRGSEVPPPGVTCMGTDLHELGIANPRIDLDNGDTVWGCQCWWGPEKDIQGYLQNKAVVEVRMAFIQGRA